MDAAAVHRGTPTLGAQRLRTRPDRLVLIPVLLGTALALPLLVYASIGSFARYTADDFCWAGILRTDGFFRAQALWYAGYSPRYAFTFLVNLAELAGPAIVPVLPTAAIVVGLATLTWTLTQFRISKTRGFVLAEAAMLATLQTAPDLAQSLYWQTGMLTYLLPLILATFLIGWIRRGSRNWSAAIVSGVVTFVAGGLSEAYLIPQNVALTLVLLVSLACAREGGLRAAFRRPFPRHAAAALAGGVLALVVILVAPSTASRVGGPPADLWLALSAAIATGGYQVARLVRFFPLTVVLCLAMPSLLGAQPSFLNIDRGRFVIVTAAVVIAFPFCYFPSFYAQNGNPPARSLIVPGAILVGYVLFLGFALQGLVQRVPTGTRAAVALALALVPISIALGNFPERASAAEYAALFDAEDRLIRASRDAGQVDVSVPPLPPNMGEDFVTADRQDWFNTCVARYYGVRSIATAP